MNEPVQIREWMERHGSELLVDSAVRSWPVIVIDRSTIRIDEPLRTKAPSPSLCRAYCCLYNTVIFYAHPYVTEPGINSSVRYYVETGRKVLPVANGARNFVEYDRVEHEITWHSIVHWAGTRWEMTAGRCLWLGKQYRWVMRIWLRSRRK